MVAAHSWQYSYHPSSLFLCPLTLLEHADDLSTETTGVHICVGRKGTKPYYRHAVRSINDLIGLQGQMFTAMSDHDLF